MALKHVGAVNKVQYNKAVNQVCICLFIIRKALCCCPVQYIHKGCRQGRPETQLLLRSEENCKMVERKLVLYLLKCALFNALFVYRTLNTNKKVKYKNFLHEVGRSWISEVQDRSESSSDDLQLLEKQTTPRGPKQDPPGRLSGDFRIHKL